MDDLATRLRATEKHVDLDGEAYKLPVNPDGPEAAARIAELEAERDEADRRAGAAERMAATVKERLVKEDLWRYRAKEERGYGFNVSFDVVWRETCAKADRADRLAAMLKEAKEALRRWLDSGCPDCGGDCANANPPVALCIMQDTSALLASLEAREEVSP
jgi:hypothetical protein